MKKGYFNRRVYEQRIVRRAVMVMIAPWIEKQVSPYVVFPLPGDEQLREDIKEWERETGMMVSKKSLRVLEEFRKREKDN